MLKACGIAGLVPGVAAPALWPIVLFFVEGHPPDWGIYPPAALSIAALAAVVGSGACVLVGGPVLLMLERAERNTPLIAGAAGCGVALLAYFTVACVYAYLPLPQAWPLAAFFALMGVLCGAVASGLSRRSSAKGGAT